MKKYLATALAVFLATGTVFAADTLKVGVQAPITGSYANEGQGIENGVRLLAEQVNAKGGVMGQQIEVMVCDDQGTAMAAAICAKDLVNKGAKMVIGSYTSTCAEAAQKTYFKAGVLQTSDGTADSLTEKGYWTFLRNSFPNSAEAKFAAEYMVKNGEEEIWKGEDRLDKDQYYEFDINGEYNEEVMPFMINGGTKSYFSKILTEDVNKVINVPVLKNAGTRVTLALKNMAYGITSNTGRGHKIWSRYIAEVCAFAAVRDKTVLNIVDGLRGCYEGGPGAVARYIWNANTVFASTDPVAVI